MVPLCVSIFLLTNILTFIINPGIIYSNNKCDEKVYCNDCQFLYSKENKEIEHCSICGVCVCNLDYHCDFIGKCIGRYNMSFFVIFVLSGILYMFIFFVITVSLLYH